MWPIYNTSFYPVECYSLDIKKKLHIKKKHTKLQKTQCEETEQAGKPGSESARMLELSDQKVFKNIINMLKNLMEKGSICIE